MQDAIRRVSEWALSHEREMAEELSRWIQIPSVRDDATATPETPFGKGCGDMLRYAQSLAKAWGFYAENHGGYCLTVGLDKPQPDDFGIIAHLDVVPAAGEWSFPPFSGEIRDGCVLGRGTTDNKSACVMGFYLLRALRELNIPLRRNIRLVLGANEETGMEDIAYYLKGNAPPRLSLVPDCLFPANYAQKGVVRGAFSVPVEEDLLRFEAGVSVNAVPADARALLALDEQTVARALGDRRDIRVSPGEGGAWVEAQGIATHAANPEKGKSALALLAAALSAAKLLRPRSQRAMEILAELASDFYGASAGIARQDPDTGRTTLVVGTARLAENRIRFTLDGRICLAMDSAEAKDLLGAYCAGQGVAVEALRATPSVYFSPETPAIRCLQEAWRELTGRDDPPYYTGGNTYSRAVPNAITFGIMGGGFGKRPDCLLPGRGAAHEADELLPASILPRALVAYFAAFSKLDKALENEEETALPRERA